MGAEQKLRTISQEELDILLIKHGKWTDSLWNMDEDESLEAENNEHDLDLSYTRLVGLDFSYKSIIFGNFEGAYIENCSFRKSFSQATNFNGAIIKASSFCCGDFENTSFKRAKIKNCDFLGADFYKADFTRVAIQNLKWNQSTNLKGSQGFPDDVIPYNCPETGKLIVYCPAYKKLEPDPRTGFDTCIIELEVPEDAKRLSGTSKSSRCNKAKVLRILNTDGTDENSITEAFIDNDSRKCCKVGEIIELKNFCEERWDEFAEGIWFFMDFQDAV